MQLLVEAVVFAIVIAILAILIGNITNIQNSIALVFISGFLGHLAFEATGINKWYCTNGNACIL
jgi:hypothetical protein